MIEFVVDGKPVPAQRMTQRGKFVQKKAQRYLAYKSAVQLIARSYMSRNKMTPYREQVKVYLDFYYKIPKSYTKKCVLTIQSSNGKERPKSQGDIDNLVKSITDSCNKICYEDDIQIAELTARKLYGDTDHVNVRIQSI